MSTTGYWRVKLEDVTLSGGPGDAIDCETDESVGCLTVPPAGLGLPEMRTEDVTYPQRDGVRQFSDWYTNRIVTLEEVTVCGDGYGCSSCSNAKQAVRQVRDAWSRKCDDVELVIYTDCHGESTPGGTTLGPNIVFNPGAEKNLDGYTSPTSLLTRDATTFRSGKFSVRADDPSDTGPVIRYGAPTMVDDEGTITTPGRIPVKAGTTYRGKVWVRAEIATTVTLAATFYDIEETELGTLTAASLLVSANAWVEMSTDDFTVPEGAVRVRTALSAPGDVTRLWSDDLFIYPVVTIPDEPADRSLVGPFGVIGRPRVAEYTWDGISGCATMTLRFDAQDHRMYVLDECGTPGSGGQTAELHVGGEVPCRTYPRCYGGSGGGTSEVVNRNRLLNPAFVPDAEWAAGSNTTAWVNAPDAPVWNGDTALQATKTGTGGNINVGGFSNRFTVTSGETLAAMCHLFPATTARRARVTLRSWDESSTSLGDVNTPWTEVPPGAYAELSGLLTLPTGAATSCILVMVETPATGEVHYVDGGMVASAEDGAVPAYFDGDTESTTNPDGTSYAYAWDGTPNDSTSRKMLITGDGGDGGWCYDNMTAGGSGPGDPVTLDVGGTLCVNPIITLYGTLTDPMVENMDTGESIGYMGTVGPVETIVFDTYAGTATSAGGNVTYLITGDPRFSIGPDDTTLRLTSYGAADDGYVTIEWRPVVDGA